LGRRVSPGGRLNFLSLLRSGEREEELLDAGALQGDTDSTQMVREDRDGG
jgi:hypothetical protein